MNINILLTAVLYKKKKKLCYYQGLICAGTCRIWNLILPILHLNRPLPQSAVYFYFHPRLPNTLHFHVRLPPPAFHFRNPPGLHFRAQDLYILE